MPSKTNDLGKEPIGKLLLKLALPSMAAQLVNALYNIVDRMYIGHLPDIGREALTGVGVTFPIIMIISAFAALVGMGGGPRAAIKMGQGDKKGAEKVMGNCLVTLVGVSVVLTVIFLIFQRPLLLLFGAGEDTTLPYALEYLTIYISGTLFVQLALGMNSFITTQGFAKTSMCTVLIGAVLNIGLDPLFMFTFNMGVRGAAIATVLSQAVSAIWVVKFLLGKRTQLKIRRQNLGISKEILLPVLALGMSPFVMQVTESAVNIALNSSLKRYGGDNAVGAMTICSSLLQMGFMMIGGITQGAQPIISFNYGAGNMGRVKKTFKLLLISCFSFSTLLWAMLMLIPKTFVMIFNDDPALTEISVWALRIFIAGFFMLGIQNACQQTFVALGQAKISLLLALLRKVILLIPLIIILPLFFQDKVMGVFMAEPVADFVAGATTGIIFMWRFPKILKKAA